MTNKNNTVLYTGVTNNLIRRVEEHKNKINPDCFTSRYNCNKLVYYQCGESVIGAIEEEKRIKGGSRAKKIERIEQMNPNWRDLFDDLIG
jgi:putative endonuclease